MFCIKRITDERMAARILGNFGVDGPAAMVYGAFEDGAVLATAVFLEKEDCLVMEDIDTGKRTDASLADAIAQAAFHAGVRIGIRQGQLGEKLPQELRLALTKRGYDMGQAFSLKAFFEKKRKP